MSRCCYDSRHNLDYSTRAIATAFERSEKLAANSRTRKRSKEFSNPCNAREFLIGLIRRESAAYLLSKLETRNYFVAQELAERGWKNVHPLYEGFDAWVNAGLPLDPK